MDNVKKGALVLISKYFGLTLKQAKDECEHLTAEDRAQLGSAIAREQGLTAEQCNFELVAY